MSPGNAAVRSWTDFTVAGQRYRKRLGTTNLQTAKKRERDLVEGAGRGLLSANEQGPKRLAEAIEILNRSGCAARRGHSSSRRSAWPSSRGISETCRSRRSPATAIADFQRRRHDAGIANRTINMDVGVLSRVLKSCGRWRAFAEHVAICPSASIRLVAH